MAKYEEYDYSHGKFIPLRFNKQILRGTFEHTLRYLIDNEIDVAVFYLRYQNQHDKTGTPAYDPRRMLKIVLYARSKGITSSREMSSPPLQWNETRRVSWLTALTGRIG